MRKVQLNKMKKLKEDPIGWLPVLFCGILAATTVVGLVRLYTHGEEAFRSATRSERNELSRMVDFQSSENGYVLNEKPYCTRITTKDGKLLWDSVGLNDNISAAWFGLLGGTSQAENTLKKQEEGQTSGISRYFITNYYEELNHPASYDLLTGMKMEDDNYQLTLDSRVQEEMYRWMTERGILGSIFAYDTSDGEIICMASTPGHEPNATDGELPGAQLNNNLYKFEPGSTMKLVTLLLLKEQGIDLSKLRFNCTGAYELKADGKIVKCTGVHGDVDVVRGIGKSCNCFFAQCIELLDFHAAQETLEGLGVVVKICAPDDPDIDSGNTLLGKIPRKRSMVRFTPDMQATFNNVFQLIGQDSLLMSPIDMASYTALCATGGTAAYPRLLENDPIQYVDVDETRAAEFREIYQYWKDGYDTYYVDDKGTWSELITTAKTGTVNVGSENARKQRTLSIWSEQLNMAAFVLVENYGDTSLDAIANHLVEVVAATQNGGEYDR